MIFLMSNLRYRGYVCHETHMLFVGLSFADMSITKLQSDICQKPIVDFVMNVLSSTFYYHLSAYLQKIFWFCPFSDRLLRFLTLLLFSSVRDVVVFGAVCTLLRSPHFSTSLLAALCHLKSYLKS